MDGPPSPIAGPGSVRMVTTERSIRDGVGVRDVMPAPDAARHAKRPSVREPILREDPDLLEELDEHGARTAMASATALIAEVPRGPWQPPEKVEGRGAPGLLVLRGVVVRRAWLAGRAAPELLGQGDVLRPWQHEGEDGMLPCSVTWEILETARIAILDARFAHAIMPWPAIMTALLGRSLRRASWQGVGRLIGGMPRVDQRLLVLFWHLAERWGRVTPGGVLVPLDLTHAAVAELVSARRPSVTTALGELSDQGLLLRPGRGRWILTAQARIALDDLCAPPRAARADLARPLAADAAA